jgi:hypothetical protein
VVTTPHVKNIKHRTLSRPQTLKLLNPTNCIGDSNNDSFSDVVGDSGLATSHADSRPVGGASQPPTPASIETERATTRKADQQKPSQRMRDIMSSFIKALDDEEDAVGNMPTTFCATPWRAALTHPITVPP